MNVRSTLFLKSFAVNGAKRQARSDARLHLNACACIAAICFVGSIATAFAEPPPLPPIVELSAYPAKLELNGIRDSRRILVTGKAADGQLIDLTLEAKLAPEGDAISVEDYGYVSPRKE